MDKFTVSIFLGLLIGIIDIIPMILKKIPIYSTISSFIHFFIVTIVIVYIDIPFIPWWLEGGIIGFLLMLPMLIHIGNNDKKPIPIITINAIVFGSIAEIVSYFILK